jgi:hypothetical protein
MLRVSHLKLNKASKMMSTYLGNDADTSEALEYLCIAEGGQVAHYKVLDAMVNDVKGSEFKNKVNNNIYKNV